MEVLQFSSNVEMVALARELLEPGNYKYSINSMFCCYRQNQYGEEEPRRCIFGRLMYGHIPEDHPFWNKIAPVKDLFQDYSIFKETFPWMNVDIVACLQSMHDDAAMNIEPEQTWEEIEKMASLIDANIHTTL